MPPSVASHLAAFGLLLTLSSGAMAQTSSSDFPPIPRPGQAPAEQPNLRQLLKPVPLSVSGEGGSRIPAPAPVYQAMPAASIAAGATDIAQVLGSTANGTLTKA